MHHNAQFVLCSVRCPCNFLWPCICMNKFRNNNKSLPFGLKLSGRFQKKSGDTEWLWSFLPILRLVDMLLVICDTVNNAGDQDRDIIGVFIEVFGIYLLLWCLNLRQKVSPKRALHTGHLYPLDIEFQPDDWSIIERYFRPIFSTFHFMGDGGRGKKTLTL